MLTDARETDVDRLVASARRRLSFYTKVLLPGAAEVVLKYDEQANQSLITEIRDLYGQVIFTPATPVPSFLARTEATWLDLTADAEILGVLLPGRKWLRTQFRQTDGGHPGDWTIIL